MSKIDLKVEDIRNALSELDNIASKFTDSTRTISTAPASLIFELGAGEYSTVAYVDAASYCEDGASEFYGDVKSVGKLETLLKQGEEYVYLLYTFRSVRQSLSLVDEKTASDSDKYYEAAFHILYEQFQKLAELNTFVTEVRSTTIDIIKNMIAKKQGEKGAKVVSEGLYERIVDIIDMMVCLDSLKDMKASLLNEFSLFKRIFEKVKHRLPNRAEIDDSIRVVQNFCIDPKTGAKNVMFYRFRNDLHTIKEQGYELILIDLVDHCLDRLKTKQYLYAKQKHKYVRVLPHLMLLIDQEVPYGSDKKKHVDVFKLKELNIDGVREVIKRYPAVPLFGDVVINALIILERLPNWDLSYYSKFHSKTMDKAAAASDTKMPTEYNLAETWKVMRQHYSAYLPHLVNMINDIERLNSVKKETGEDITPPELGGVVIQTVYKGLQLISNWTGAILEQASWKYVNPAETHECVECKEDLPISYFSKREWEFDPKLEEKMKLKRGVAYIPAKGACVDCCKIQAMIDRKMKQAKKGGKIDMTEDEMALYNVKAKKLKQNKGQEYAKVVRFNYTPEELSVLVDCISMIKSVSSLITKAEVVLAGPIRQGIHQSIQNFVQNTIIDWLHVSDKSDSHRRFKWVRDILLKLRESVGDWKDGVAPIEDYKSGHKHRSSIQYKIPKRNVAPSTSQLFFVRTMIRALYDDNSPGVRKSKWKRNTVLSANDVAILKDFYKDLIKYVPLLDLSNSVRQASDLSDLWYREFHLEMTKCTQFPIDMSLPWIVTEHVIKSPSSNNIENLLYALDLYNDAANRSLYCLKQKFLYDEIEAEVNLVFDQLIFVLCDSIYGYYKNMAASSLLDKPYRAKLQKIKGIPYLETDKRRFEVLMTQRRFQLLGRTINFNELISERINDYMVRDLDNILLKFESQDITAVVELDKLLSIVQMMHKVLSEYLSLDPFTSMVAEVNQAIAPTTYRGRIAMHVVAEIIFDLIPNSTYNTTSRRFVRSDISYEDKIDRKKMEKNLPSSFIYGTRCLRSYEKANRLRKEYFGQVHAAALVRVLGFAELPMITEEILNNRIISEINGGDLSEYVSVLTDGLMPCKLLGNWGFYGAHGIYGFFEAKLDALIQYGELKSRVFHKFRMIGNSLALLHIIEGVSDIHDIVGFLHVAPYLGCNAETPLPKNESGPLIHIVKSFEDNAAKLLSEESQKAVSGSLFAAKRAHVMHKSSASSLVLLRPALNKICEVLKDRSDVFNPVPENGLLEVEECESFHRLWSSMQFLFETPLDEAETSSHISDEGAFGDGFAWGGIALIYLCGQMSSFEILDFSYHVLKVAEWEETVEAAKNRSILKKKKNEEVGDVASTDLKRKARAFINCAKRGKMLNDQLFSIFETALPEIGLKDNGMIPTPPEDDSLLSESRQKIVRMTMNSENNSPRLQPAPSIANTTDMSLINPPAVYYIPPPIHDDEPPAIPPPVVVPGYDDDEPAPLSADDFSPPPPPMAGPSSLTNYDLDSEVFQDNEDEDEDEYPPPPAGISLPSGGAFAIALWSYEAADNTELTFAEDQYIVVTEQETSDWWNGYLADDPDCSVLMLPANYVELI